MKTIKKLIISTLMVAMIISCMAFYVCAAPYQLPKEGITVTSSNEAVGFEAGKAIDGDEITMWHTMWENNAPVVELPQSLLFNFGKKINLSSMQYKTRVDGMQNGNVEEYKIYAGNDLNSLTEISSGELDSSDVEFQDITFTLISTTYIKFEVISAINGFASAAEIVFFADDDVKINSQTSTSSALVSPSETILLTNSPTTQKTPLASPSKSSSLSTSPFPKNKEGEDFNVAPIIIGVIVIAVVATITLIMIKKKNIK